MTRCKAITKKGHRCTKKSAFGEYCLCHYEENLKRKTTS